jgi:hypothetical protein
VQSEERISHRCIVARHFVVLYSDIPVSVSSRLALVLRYGAIVAIK